MPKIKHTILQWARETAQLSIEEAAYSLYLKDSKKASATKKITAFESGENDPSRSLLLRMSKKYRQPLLTFYLDKPPKSGDRGEDFRTLPSQFEGTDNVNIDFLIRNIKARQGTVRETLIDADEGDKLEFIGKHKIDASVPDIVFTIQNALNINIGEYCCHPSYKEAFRFLRQKIELAGIYVLLQGNLGSYHSNIAVNAFRGFALSDDIAPFIVINDQDAKSAWSFTLIHEMAHLVLGKTGISGTSGEKQIEKLCNDVASEFMLPAVKFNGFQLTSLDFEILQNEVSDYAFSQKVSSSHIAYRLYRRGDIDNSLWKKLHEFYRKKWLEDRKITQKTSKQNKGGPSYYTIKQYKLGALVGLVQRLTYAGALTTTKAGMLLEVKPLKVHNLFQTGQLV